MCSYGDRRPVTGDEATSIAEQMQFHALAALVEARRWQAGDVIFHGGSSLYFGYGSPRRSEDLNFLITVSAPTSSIG